MTIYQLHQSIQKRVQDVIETAGFHGLQVFIRNTPSLKYEGDANEYFPNCVIKMGDGSDSQEQSSVTIVLVLGTMDNEPELKGYEEICHLIEILRLDFAENSILDKYFEIKQPINFTLAEQESDTYPYFFGAVWFDVQIPSPQRGYNEFI